MQPNKAVLLVGCAGAATAFLASRHWQPVLGELSFAAYAVSAGSGIFAYAVQLRRHVPAPRRLFSAYHDKPAADILSPVAAKWADGSYVRYRSGSEQETGAGERRDHPPGQDRQPRLRAVRDVTQRRPASAAPLLRQCSVMLDAGGSVKELAEYLGHRDAALTLRGDPVGRIGQRRLGPRCGELDLAGVMCPLPAGPGGPYLVQGQAAGHHDEPAGSFPLRAGEAICHAQALDLPAALAARSRLFLQEQ